MGGCCATVACHVGYGQLDDICTALGAVDALAFELAAPKHPPHGLGADAEDAGRLRHGHLLERHRLLGHGRCHHRRCCVADASGGRGQSEHG